MVSARLLPAGEVVDRFLVYLRDALEELGDWEEVSGLLERARRCGTSARRQHDALARTGRLSGATEMLAAETLPTTAL